jgi:hypothetical protein
MEYTPAQKEQIQRDYGARRQRQLMMTLPLGLVILALIFTDDNPGGSIMGIRADVFTALMVGLILIIALVSFRNWRCPGCNKYLGRAFNPNFCQRCGVQLHD